MREYYNESKHRGAKRISTGFHHALPGARAGKGFFAEENARHAFSGSAAEQVRDCHAVKQCVALCYMQYDIILHFVPVFKPVFLLSRVWQQNGLNVAAGLCLPPANLRRQLHIGNGMGLGTEAESPNVRWGSGGKDGSLR